MAIKYTDLNKYLYTPSTKMLVLPASYLLIMGLLILISVRIGMSKIQSQRQDLSQVTSTYNTLLEKDTTLKSSQSDVAYFILSSTLAVPSKDPVLAEMVQVKALATQFLLPIDELKVSASGSSSDSLLRSQFSFKVAGEVGQIILFVKSLSQIAPLTTVDKVEITSSEGSVVLASISISSHWNKMPDALPAITDPIKKLTNDDMEALQLMAKLTPPPFSDLPPLGTSSRANPFLAP